MVLTPLQLEKQIEWMKLLLLHERLSGVVDAGYPYRFVMALPGKMIEGYGFQFNPLQGARKGSRIFINWILTISVIPCNNLIRLEYN